MSRPKLLHFHHLRDRLLRRCMLVTVVTLVLFMALVVHAKDDNSFLLHNSSDFTIVSFKTQERGEDFSDNWIRGDRIKPGETFEMEFYEEGRCEVRVRVVSADRYVHDYLVDFCRAREIFIENDRISYR